MYGLADAIRTSARRRGILLQDIAKAIQVTPSAMSRKLKRPGTFKFCELIVMAELLRWSEAQMVEILKAEQKKK